MSDDAEPPDLADVTQLSPQARSGDASPLPPLDGARYRVDDGPDAELGRGGQGVVLRARDELLRREVALKVLRPAAAADPAVVASFLREARLTALLAHPGIVPLHDLGVGPGGTATLVLRRIEGKSLAETLAAAPALDARLALVPAVLRACQAVAFAHERGVVHRDLKPQNVMLGSLGETYVVDWGLARVVGGPLAADFTEAHELPGVVGTPAYMSPEQALGLAADARSDVWGLGACLYQVLTGRPPVAGGSIASAVGHAAAGEVQPVRALEPGVPADLAAICHKALSPERERRYASAVALSQDLERWLAGRTVSAREYSRLELLQRAARANRGALAVAAAALVALGAVLGVNEWRVREQRNHARTFARTLLLDAAALTQSRKADVDLLSLLTRRTRDWLSEDQALTDIERAEVCALLVALASLHADLERPDEARDLGLEAVRVAERGAARAPGEPAFLACSVSARTDLAWAAASAGTEPEPERAFAALDDEVKAWRGRGDPRLTLAHADLLNAWGLWLWEREPQKAAERLAASARLAQQELNNPVSQLRAQALSYGTHGVLGLWGLGRRDEALALAETYARDTDGFCARPGVDIERGCVLALDAWAQQLAWRDDPRAPALLEDVERREAKLLERSSDSVTVLQDAMWSAFEHGDFAEASRLGARLRATGEDGDLERLAAVLAGEPVPLDAFGDGPREAADQLAYGLALAAGGRFHDAAAALRAVKRAHLWFELAWTPHPRPRLVLPEAARPAFERFLADFTRAFGAADSAALADSVDAFAAALDALPGADGGAAAGPR